MCNAVLSRLSVPYGLGEKFLEEEAPTALAPSSGWRLAGRGTICFLFCFYLVQNVQAF
jgi:hypothetical protein